MRAILFFITILAFLFLDLPSLLMKKVKSLNSGAAPVFLDTDLG